MRPPLSIRQSEPGLDEPLVEGIPEHMFQGVGEWISDIFWSDFLDPDFGQSEQVKQGCVTEKVWRGWVDDLRKRLQRTEQYLRLPLDWRQELLDVKYELLEWLENHETALDLLDYCLGEHARRRSPKETNQASETTRRYPLRDRKRRMATRLEHTQKCGRTLVRDHERCVPHP